MKITIDASKLLTKTPTGVEVYCKNIIRGLLKQHNNLILYTPTLIIDLPAKNQQILSWPINKLWSQLRLGFELLIHPPDVFFSPGYVIPFFGLLNKKIRKIVTIHDVAFIHLSQSYSVWQKYFLKLTTHQAVKYADKIITPTQTTADELIKYFNCPVEKIKVVYLGYEKEIYPELAKDLANTAHNGILRRPDGTPQDKLLKFKKQILYIGRVEDKKNIGNLIQAFEIFNKKYLDYQLILAGKLGYGFNYGFNKDKYSISNIQYLDYVSDEQKEQLLQESSCLVLVSKYEGFGIPLLEGFSYQLPVLASDIPVLKEIGQKACLFVNPQSPQAIADGLEKITQNQELRTKLIQSGIQRLQDFSWQKCIKQTWEILDN